MRLSRVSSLLALLSCGAPAAAQSAADAFACKLPYVEAAKAVGKLSVKKRREPLIVGRARQDMMELVPGTTRIFGQQPVELFADMFDPGGTAPDKIYRMTFRSAFARTPAVDAALLTGVAWTKSCNKDAASCSRQGDTDLSTQLVFRRDRPDRYWLDCKYRVQESDVPN